MSETVEPQRPTNGTAPTFVDEKMYLLNRIAEDIAPNLAERPQDRIMAMQMAWRTVKSYAPASEAEVLGAARIVSMSLVQMDLLRETTNRDLTPAMKLRFVNAAVSLGKSIAQTERALERRQRAEERKPVREISPEPARVCRDSNLRAATEAMAADAMEEFAMRQEIERVRQVAASFTTDPEADSAPAQQSAADQVNPAPQTDKAGPVPDGPDMVDAFLRQMQAKHHRHPEAWRNAIPKCSNTQSQDVRQPGAGGQPGHKRAAGPG